MLFSFIGSRGTRKEKRLTLIDQQKQETKRDEAQPQHKNLIDELPVVGDLLGNVSLGCGFEYKFRSTNRSLQIEQGEPAPRYRERWYQWLATRWEAFWKGIYIFQTTVILGAGC